MALQEASHDANAATDPADESQQQVRAPLSLSSRTLVAHCYSICGSRPMPMSDACERAHKIITVRLQSVSSRSLLVAALTCCSSQTPVEPFRRVRSCVSQPTKTIASVLKFPLWADVAKRVAEARKIPPQHTQSSLILDLSTSRAKWIVDWRTQLSKRGCLFGFADCSGGESSTRAGEG